jgi:hypothetical protein
LGFPVCACNPKALKLMNGNIVIFYYTTDHKLMRLEKKYADSTGERVLWNSSEIATSNTSTSTSNENNNNTHNNYAQTHFSNSPTQMINTKVSSEIQNLGDNKFSELPQGELFVTLSTTGTEFVYYISVLGHLIEFSKPLMTSPLKNNPTGWVQRNIHKLCNAAIAGKKNNKNKSRNKIFIILFYLFSFLFYVIMF